jgi:hypothetical protein
MTYVWGQTFQENLFADKLHGKPTMTWKIRRNIRYLPEFWAAGSSSDVVI